MAQDQSGYMLTEAAVKKLAEIARYHQRHSRNQHPPRYRRQTVRPGTGSTWIGTLQGTLAYGSTATVMLQKWNGSAFVNDTTDTVYPWMMNAGDSIAANVQIVGGTVGGKRVCFNAACKNIYGS